MIKVTAKRPSIFHHRRMLDYIRSEAKLKYSEHMLKGVRRVTSGWKGDQPEWRVVYIVNQYRVIVKIEPVDPDAPGALKWLWLDEGTAGPYRIPKEGNELRSDGSPRVLAFPSVYNAGSRPGSLRTYPASSGGDMVFSRFVTHPGIKARGWTDLLLDEWGGLFDKWMDPVMTRAARISGHGG